MDQLLTIKFYDRAFFFGSRTFKKYPELIGDTRYVEDYARITNTQKQIEVMVTCNIDHVTYLLTWTIIILYRRRRVTGTRQCCALTLCCSRR
jgi:hypothetical protein